MFAASGSIDPPCPAAANRSRVAAATSGRRLPSCAPARGAPSDHGPARGSYRRAPSTVAAACRTPPPCPRHTPPRYAWRHSVKPTSRLVSLLTLVAPTTAAVLATPAVAASYRFVVVADHERDNFNQGS